MATVTYSFTLDSEKNKRLYRWLEGLGRGEKSKAIRKALIAHLGQNDITLRDIYDAIQDLKRSGVSVMAQDTEKKQPDVPPDVLANLSGLGLD